MLEIQNVSKTFNAGTVNQKTALNGLNLKLNEGDFVTVIGGNGAGKSTMLNAVAGVWPVDEGKIIIDGVDVTRLSEHQRAAYIGRVFQDPMTGTAATMQIEENLAIAIGRGGQNVRLASELTGWQINIMTAEEANKKQEEEDRVACEEFMNELDMSQDDAVALIHDGIYSLEELAYVPEQEIVELGIFDEATVADLRERARRVLLARALKREENLRQADASLLELEGMDHDLASRLVSEGIKTADELGDLDTEELMEKGGIAEDKARALIMAARARWTEE